MTISEIRENLHMVNIDLKNHKLHNYALDLMFYFDEALKHSPYGDQLRPGAIYDFYPVQCCRCGKSLHFQYLGGYDFVMSHINVETRQVDSTGCQHVKDGPERYTFDVSDRLVFKYDTMKRSDIEKSLPDDKTYNVNSDLGYINKAKKFAENGLGLLMAIDKSTDLFRKGNDILFIDGYKYEGDQEYYAEDELPSLGYEYLGTLYNNWIYFLNKKDSLNDVSTPKIELDLPIGKYVIEDHNNSDVYGKDKVGRYSIIMRMLLTDKK